MSEALRTIGTGDTWASESYAKVTDTIGALVTAGVTAGTIRSDLETADVVLAMSGLLRLDASGDWRAQGDRLIGSLMDGLRAGAKSS
ncbi:hypothetical protein [Streptomyces pseudovenezuelae]|uniref:Transcriptional regulator SbtR-like C-terminal domain-containing protein n=1 Tax=Streptomyces pseudovenezuelae TaxID=67350 RepID=A0ABT6LQV4_9ACTN|nr:hypothetical protein [Streptomyces pseudovenezuelae]MDH6218687.1 hypothetical protein [Streptomyces pseudovenezuelae]